MDLYLYPSGLSVLSYIVTDACCTILGTYYRQQSMGLCFQNITRDIEIKNKLTVHRGEVGGDIWEIRGKGCQGTGIKDIWTKPNRVGLRGRECVGEMGTTVLEQ